MSYTRWNELYCPDNFLAHECVDAWDAQAEWAEDQDWSLQAVQETKKENSTEASTPERSKFPFWSIPVCVFLIAVGLIAFGLVGRQRAYATLVESTTQSAAPPVALELPTVETTAGEIILPGNLQPYTLAPIYARTTGYVAAWYHDIGSSVRKGELLATIETPELDEQLSQAKADLQTAESNAKLARLTSDRYGSLIGSNAVSQQDTDIAANQLDARKTQIAAAMANVRRLEQLQSFERILAPFDGVITTRNIDVGQLITAAGTTTTAGAGTVSGSKQMFDIAAVKVLRVFVNVPQVSVGDVKEGSRAGLTLPQYPGRSFEGILVRSAKSVDPLTRTLLVEIDVKNDAAALLPGSYAEVHLITRKGTPVLVIPVNALILQPSGSAVATVDVGHRIRMVQVVSGRDFGTTVEILHGLLPTQKIIGNPSDSLTDGQEVRIVDTKFPAIASVAAGRKP